MTTTNNSLGLYLHIPFCVKKCKYCDFLSFRCSDSAAISEYAKALIAEINLKSVDWRYREVDSVYIGGGTPSLLSAWDIGKVMDSLRENFNVAEDAEITIEANPATLSDEKLERYLRKGINRLSIGVQSFENHILQILGRVHSKNDAFYNFQRAKRAGFDNINVDIMFGIPGQNMKMWKDTVRETLFLKPAHISLYSLQIEEGTEFYDMIKDGVMQAPDEETDREMYHMALKMMRSSGYEHYEISNSALPGYRSRHNLKYWSYAEYLGMGLGASSFMNGSRFNNYDSMYHYMKALNESKAPVDEKSIKNYSKREEMGIYVFTGLRKMAGIDLVDFKETFELNFFDVFDKGLIEKFKGCLVLEGDKLHLTEKGMDISNRIMAEFI